MAIAEAEAPAPPRVDTDLTYTTAWTDGSSTGGWGPGGWAWVIVDGPDAGRHASGGCGWTTNQREELKAAHEAMLAIDGLLLIVSDSEYVVHGFTEWSKKWRADGWHKVGNADLWRPAIELYLSRRGEVRFEWVKGHSGVVGNDAADELARDARLAVPRDEWGPPGAADRAAYDADGGHTANGKATAPPRPAKAARDPDARYYTRQNLGPNCAARCGLRIPLALSNAGVRVHPTCSGARW